MSTVRTESGLISGDGTDIVAYRGIPYAAPPVGDLRWKPPRKAPAWSGVRECTGFGDDPVQMPGLGFRGPRIGEDCLTLNIWTPAASGGKLPVMVWFYGGGFILGSSSFAMYDGAALARKGAVIVTLNYRLGILGFMAHPALTAESPEHSSGNYGFLDQVAALKWVRENIAGFGGDPNNVTLFGESAGGISVAAHLLSPLSQGLFHRAILESPAVLRSLYTLPAAETAAVAVVGTDLAALRAMPADELLPKTFEIGAGPRALTAAQPINMIVDGWAFPEDARAAFLAGRFAKVPMIIGGVEEEGAFFAGTALPIKSLDDFEGFIKIGLGRFAAEGAALYPAGNAAEALTGAAAAFGDSLFNYGVRGLARLNAKDEKRTFRYLFTRRRGGKPTPPSHVEEVPYVFGTLDQPFFGPPPPTDATDRRLSDAMMEAWVRFAATGDPNGGGLDWPAYDPAKDNYILFGEAIGHGAHWRAPYLDFFERVFAAG